MLYLNALNRAVTALLGYHQKPNGAVKISVHYTALYSPPHCNAYQSIKCLVNQ